MSRELTREEFYAICAEHNNGCLIGSERAALLIEHIDALTAQLAAAREWTGTPPKLPGLYAVEDEHGKRRRAYKLTVEEWGLSIWGNDGLYSTMREFLEDECIGEPLWYRLPDSSRSYIADAPRKPAEVFPPGHFIREELRKRGWTDYCLSRKLSYPVETIHRILTGEYPLTRTLCVALAKAFGTSAEMWLNLQAEYERHKENDRG